jgi:hypothetical protein
MHKRLRLLTLAKGQAKVGALMALQRIPVDTVVTRCGAVAGLVRQQVVVYLRPRWVGADATQL